MSINKRLKKNKTIRQFIKNNIQSQSIFKPYLSWVIVSYLHLGNNDGCYKNGNTRINEKTKARSSRSGTKACTWASSSKALVNALKTNTTLT